MSRPVRHGTCPQCARQVRLTIQGRLWGHGIERYSPTSPRGFAPHCAGSYRWPLTGSELPIRQEAP